MTTTPTHHPITGERLYTREEFLKLAKEHIELQGDILLVNLQKKRAKKRNDVAYV